MRSHGHDLWDNSLIGPLYPENFCKFFEVMRCRFTNGEHGVAQPPHTESRELFVEEFDP